MLRSVPGGHLSTVLFFPQPQPKEVPMQVQRDPHTGITTTSNEEVGRSQGEEEVSLKEFFFFFFFL